MERKLIDYLPSVVREYIEFQGITGSEQPELERVWMDTDALLSNQFLPTAGNMGLSRWEAILGITPQKTDTLDVRRARIKAKWNVELPYTVRWLQNWLLKLCGSEGYALSIEEYTIHIQLDYNLLSDIAHLTSDLRTMLLAVRPANMQIAMAGSYQANGTVFCGAYTLAGVQVELWPELVNRVEVRGAVSTDGKSAVRQTVEVWPEGRWNT